MATEDYITLPLSQGYLTIISCIDEELAKLKWTARIQAHSVYAYRKHYPGDGTSYNVHLHRVILERMIGRPLANNEYADHISGNGLDNRRENLRLATKAENCRNQRKKSNNPYKGITQIKTTGKWCAKIRVNGKTINLGHYDTPELAHEAYCKAAKEHFGDFARFE